MRLKTAVAFSSHRAKNGEISLDAADFKYGANALQIFKVADNGCPAVLRFAPDFTVELLNGKKITLSSLQEKALMLIFFSTGCPDCQAQFSEMQRLVSQSEPRFRIIAISRAESRETTAAFIQKYGLNIDVGIDPDRSIYDKYATHFVPRNYLIDNFGEIKALTVEYLPNEFHSIWQQAEDLAR